MRYRKLRIAWSVAWGIACVLLIALWVRSYWWLEQYQFLISTRYVIITSAQGTSHISSATNRVWTEPQLLGFRRYSLGVDVDYSGPSLVPWLYRNVELPSYFTIVLPYWLLLLFAAILAVAPWSPGCSRFSLRTLLIATTLVAVLLGFLACYMHW
jgi:hypothetical protein